MWKFCNDKIKIDKHCVNSPHNRLVLQYLDMKPTTESKGMAALLVNIQLVNLLVFPTRQFALQQIEYYSD